MLTKKVYIPIGVCLVLLLALGFLSLRSDVPDEPVKIYKAVEVSKPPAHPTAKVPVGDTSQGGHWHGDVWHSEPHTGAADVFPERDDPTGSLAAANLSDLGETESEATDWEYSEEAGRLAENFTQDWNRFQQDLQSKYAVLFNPERLTKIAETRQGRRELKSQIEAMIEETLAKLEELLKQLPPEFSQKLLDVVETQSLLNNPGIQPQYLKESFEMIRKRLY